VTVHKRVHAIDGDDHTGTLDQSQLPGTLREFGLSCGGDQKAYVGTNSTSWTARRYIIFDGTDELGTPTAVKFLVSTGSSQCDARLYDETNGNEIASVSTTSGTPTIVTDSSTSNWPASESVLRLDLKRTGGGKARCFALKAVY